MEKTFKKSWGDGPVITRVKLIPEQAVLLCCSTTGAGPKQKTPLQNRCTLSCGSNPRDASIS